MGILILYKAHVTFILLFACIFMQYSSAFLPGKGRHALAAPIRKTTERHRGKFTGEAARLMVPPIPQAGLLISDASNALPSSITLAEGFISTIQTLFTLAIFLVAFRAIAGPVVQEGMEGTAVDAFLGGKDDSSVPPVLTEEPEVEAKKVEVEKTKDYQAEEAKEKEAAEKAMIQEEKKKSELKAAQEAEEERKAAAREKEAQRIAAEKAQRETEEKAAAQTRIEEAVAEKTKLEKAAAEKTRLIEEEKKAEADKAKKIEEEEKAALERARKLKEQQQADMEMVKAYAKEKEKINKLKRTLEDNGKSEKFKAPTVEEVKTNEGKGEQGTNVEEALSMAVAKKSNSDESPSKSSKKSSSLSKGRSMVVVALVLVLGGRLIRALIGRGMV